MNDFDNKQICLYKDIDRFGFTCDVCGRKVNGCHYINGMSFCEKCYQETFGKDNQQNEIQQLKQQLEEKDKEIAYLKEIRILKDNSNMSTKINGVDFSDEQILTLQVLDILKRYNQKALAIQELEKVKNFIDGRTYCADYINKRIQELKGE